MNMKDVNRKTKRTYLVHDSKTHVNGAECGTCIFSSFIKVEKTG